jgi:hydrogenase maturation protease
MRDALPETDGRARLRPVRIVGIGSPFGADRIGWDIADAIARDPWFAALSPGRVSVERADRPGARLLELLEDPGLVVLIDAMQGGGARGTVRCFDGRDLPAAAGFSTTHDFGIKAALDLAGALGEIAPEVRVFGIEIGEPPGAPAATAAGPSGIICEENIINEIKLLVNNFNKSHKESTDARNP